MKLTIEGTTDEIKKVLQAIYGSEEHEEANKLAKYITRQGRANNRRRRGLL